MPAGAPSLADSLRDRYRLERELGRGGMATVYLASDLRHDRPVALKVLHPELAATLGPERFLREIRLTARLQHPHILPVFDSGDADGRLWYTMPYVEGESLRGRLRREARLEVDEAVRLAREVADALDYAHRRGIIHRDVKPENILLSETHALVADFGVARAPGAGPERLTQTGLVLGTPAYMSPEQATGEAELDARSDVFALGCVLYEMLAGATPFPGATLGAVLARQFAGPPPELHAARGDVPLWLSRTVARALAPDPGARFAGAAELARSLAAPAPTVASAAGPAGSPPASASTASGGTSGAASPARRAPRSIAVLPLVNLSPDPENEYFSDGMTDELINALAKVPGLHVVSRTSAFAFKGRALDVRAIGAQLGVETVLEGSVRRAGRRLRLAAQLVNVADGYQLWSETFDREFEDVFAIQDEVSRGIVDTLRIKLLGRAAGPLVRPATDDYEAYTLYLKGRHHWNRRTEGALRQGLEFFQHALERDPDYPLAHVGVADSYAILGFYCELPPAEAFPAARAAAQRALALDPALAEAHPALAYVAMYHDWDWAAAEREFLLAIELNPGYATAHQWYGNFLAVLGRFAESEAAFSRGIALDPLSALRNASLGWGYYFAREYARAVAQCRRALELDPDLAVANLWLGISLEQAGELEEAAVALRRAYQISGNPGNLAALAHALGLAGRRSDAASLEGQLRDLAAARYVSAYDLALAHLGSGDTAEALASLERGYAERTHQMVFLKVDPRLDPLRADPGFADLMRRMRL